MNRHERRAQAKQAQANPPKIIKIMLCVPSMRTWDADMSASFCAMQAFSMLRGLGLALIHHKGSQITHGRNTLVSGALEANPDYLFWWDSDIVAPPNCLLRLMSHQKDIAGAFYNRRRAPYNTLGQLKSEEYDVSAGGLAEAEYMPGGMVLVKADVYRKLKWPWYLETYWRDQAIPGMSRQDAFFEMLNDYYNADVPANMRQQLEGYVDLMDWIEKQGKKPGDTDPKYASIGEDYSFCRKAIRAGYQIWCDLDLTFEMGHIGEHLIQCKRPEKKSG